MKDNLYKIWFGPLPKEHLKVKDGNGREYLYKYLVHPVKRRVAKYYLLFLRLFGLKVVGITGSAGKTTAKEMLASILSRKGATRATQANIDPVYNIPTTILRCNPLTRFLVLEMGVEFPGEMDYYLWLARPDTALITNIYPTHTEFFKDVRGVLKEKSKLALSIKKGCVVLNGENHFLKALSGKVATKKILYGEGSMVNARQIRISDTNTEFVLGVDKEETVIHLPTLGEQFVSNALGAAAVGHCLGVGLEEIKKGLEEYRPLEHRMERHVTKSGAVVLDDSYNNNPEAAYEAVKTLKTYAGQRKTVVVLGDMLELGSLTKSSHQELGERILSFQIDYLIGVGEEIGETVKLARRKMGERAIWAKDVKEAVKLLKPHLNKDTVVLIKGSRKIGLDRLVGKLL